jgi:diguanylate cyclase (GGDEF)-like protein
MTTTLVGEAATSRAGEEMADAMADRLGHAFRYLVVALVVLGLVLAALFGYLLGSVLPAQSRYSDGARAVALAHDAMINQETGLRGYLVVHDKRFLQPYKLGITSLAEENTLANQFIGTDPVMAPILLDMRLAEQQWISQWALVVAAGKAPAGVAALTAFLFQGKVLFDDYRVQELRLTNSIEDRRDDLQHDEVLAFGIGLSILVLVGGALVLGMTRQRRLLRDMVVTPVAAIVAATEEIARGDFSARVDPHGPEEFRQIATSVNLMADALVLSQHRADLHQGLIEEQEQKLRKILVMAREIAGSLSLRYVLRSVATSAASVSGFPRVTIWLRGDDLDQGLVEVFDTATHDGTPTEGRTAEVGVGALGQAVKFGRPATDVVGEEPSVEVHTERPLRSLAVPLVVGARVSGALEFSSDDPRLLSANSLEVLETLAIHAAASIEAARLHGHAEELGRTDALTGLANRRTLDSDLAMECERTSRYERPLALIMFDVDHFKDFNDAFGHQRGDEALQELAATVRLTLRATDTAYRYGGEEFLVMARETPGDQATVLAERLRSRIQDHFAAHGSLAPITASFGIGIFPPGEATPARLIGSADAALYEAKARGRNRVQSALTLVP